MPVECLPFLNEGCCTHYIGQPLEKLISRGVLISNSTLDTTPSADHFGLCENW